MELPHMGQHCSEATCKQLDYLPMKCDACHQLFCKDHLLYDDHGCASKYKKDVQVPVCPLCNAPVPVPRGTVPDLAISAHMDQGCTQEAKEKVFTNRCNKPKCKKKELVKVVCDTCKLNFCLTHRHPKDHDCKGPTASGRQAASKAVEAAAARAAGQSTQSKITSFFSGPFRAPAQPAPSRAAPAAARTAGSRQAAAASLQNGMSEDEALAAALAASMSEVPGGQQQVQGLNQEDEDRLLAQALQESERESRMAAQRTTSTDQDKNCVVS